MNCDKKNCEGVYEFYGTLGRGKDNKYYKCSECGKLIIIVKP